MWHEIIRLMNANGMYRCIKCDKDVEYGTEGIDFEYENGYDHKICIECAKEYSVELNELLFVKDIIKIKTAVTNYPIGSHQIGEISKLSGLLSEKGVDVVGKLQKLYDRSK